MLTSIDDKAICGKRSCDIVFMKMKVVLFYLRKTISGSCFKESNSDLGLCVFVPCWSRDQNVILELPRSEHKFAFKLQGKCGNVYSPSEGNYQTLHKIQAKSSFGRHTDALFLAISVLKGITHKLG